jgi:hypothetical protein
MYFVHSGWQGVSFTGRLDLRSGGGCDTAELVRHGAAVS